MLLLLQSAFFVDGILAGLFLCSGMVEHAARTLGAQAWLAYKQAKEVVFAKVMPPVSLVAVILTGAGMYAKASVVWGVAFACIVVALAITAIVHLPLNRQFDAWTAQSMPARWVDQRDKWRRWNWIRIAFAVAAFAVMVFF